MPHPKIAAILPAWNEEGAVGATIARLPPRFSHIIVVDGGSTDATASEARAAGAILHAQTRPGYGAACHEGAELAIRLGAEILLFLDADGADPAEHAAALLDPLEADRADFVIANRTFRDPGSMLWHQILAGRVIGTLVGWRCGTHYRDMSAFRALRADTLRRLDLQDRGYGWNLEMQMRAAFAGLRIHQIDLPYHCRAAGHSKVAGSLRGTLRASARILRVLLRLSLTPPIGPRPPGP